MSQMWTKGQPLGDVARSPISILTENKLYSSLSVLPARSLAKQGWTAGEMWSGSCMFKVLA